MSRKNFHERSLHNSPYQFVKLMEATPELIPFVIKNPKGEQTINFYEPVAVKLLNKALLKYHYQIQEWDIPAGYLSPPIPGRADYIHYVADLLADNNGGKIPKGNQVKCLDIGSGANCIYPILGSQIYGWSFVGSDIDAQAIKAAQRNIHQNFILKNKIELRLQSNSKSIFSGVLKTDEYIELTICNPPFHASEREAEKATERKLKNLKGQKIKTVVRNFGGQHNELWCEGGERKFIESMIKESVDFSENCFWFTTLVSKESNLKPINSFLKKAKVTTTKTIPMHHGNKSSRIVAWTFLTQKKQAAWQSIRWKK